MLLGLISNGWRDQQLIQPFLNSSDFTSDEGLIPERRGDDRHTLRPDQKMHRVRLCLPDCPKGLKLARQPATEQAKDFRGTVLRGVVELGQFRAQRSDRATEGHDLGAIGDQQTDERQDTVARRRPLGLPIVEHLACPLLPARDHRIQDRVLGLEVMVEIAA